MELCAADASGPCASQNCLATVDELASWIEPVQDGDMYAFKAEMDATFSSDSSACAQSVFDAITTGASGDTSTTLLLASNADDLDLTSQSPNVGTFEDWSFQDHDSCVMAVIDTSITSQPTASPTTGSPTAEELIVVTTPAPTEATQPDTSSSSSIRSLSIFTVLMTVMVGILHL